MFRAYSAAPDFAAFLAAPLSCAALVTTVQGLPPAAAVRTGVRVLSRRRVGQGSPPGPDSTLLIEVVDPSNPPGSQGAAAEAQHYAAWGVAGRHK